MVKKKKVIIHTDFALSKTGFGRNAKALLTYLYNTGKYDLVNLACGMVDEEDSQELAKTPWKTIGAITGDQKKLNDINSSNDQKRLRDVSYGSEHILEVVKEEKPDVYIGIQDFWGVDFSIKSTWFKKIPSAIWVTLDSLPIFDAAIKNAKAIENYWVWSSFAEKELHRLGFGHVKTVHGIVDEKFFYRLGDNERKLIRAKNHIDLETYMVGFVFRNQLRKSVPNLLEGYKKFKEKNPNQKSGLLLHTNYSEGWEIPKLVKEYEIDEKEIFTTYVCKECGEYAVTNFQGQSHKCPYCNSEKSFSTTGVNLGVTEKQLNEVYNLMDVYCHPFTSGGQEIPIQEAKLTELITLVTNYSCGEECCEEGSYSLPLDWAEYREHGTQFKKASTYPDSICEKLTEALLMPQEQKNEWGKKAREWVLSKFSNDVVGGFVENFIDAQEDHYFDFVESVEDRKDPNANVPFVKDDSEWIKALYKNILKRDVDPTYDGHQYWMSEISKGSPKQDIEAYFRKVAKKESEGMEKEEYDLSSHLDKDDKGRRIIFVLPGNERDVLYSTSLLRDLKKTYPDYNLYYATKAEYFGILEANEYIHKVIEFNKAMEQPFYLEGKGKDEGFCDVAFLPYFSTQKTINYTHNAKDKINFDLKCVETFPIR
jgi:hypothetical protein